MFQFFTPKEDHINGEKKQRIVVVEDLEMPKFDPPDIDKIKEICDQQNILLILLPKQPCNLTAIKRLQEIPLPL